METIFKLGVFILFGITESQKNCGNMSVNYNRRKQGIRNYKIYF